MSWFMVGAAAVMATSSIMQGEAAKDAADSNAKALEYNAASDRARAVQASAMAGIKEDEQRRVARAVIGEQLASSASAGAGLNSDLLRQSIFNVESDAGAIRYDGQLKAAGLRDQATMQQFEASNSRRKGESAQTAGYLNAAGSLFNAGSSYSARKK